MEAIDLGLSVKWVSCNLGAAKPEEYGNYYAWGETEPKTTYDDSTYKWVTTTYDTEYDMRNLEVLTKYNTNTDYGTVDNKAVLDLKDDAANVNLSGGWRIPTDEEWTELRENCTWKWKTLNGVNGYEVKGPNGNSIFLPAAGYRDDDVFSCTGSYGFYWSSSLYTDYPDDAWGVGFNSNNVGRGDLYRCCGQSVRPVLSNNF